MNLFELGQALKTARIQQLLTQDELATRTGISLSTISKLERGTLSEIGTVRLLSLFAAVKLELRPYTAGYRRTLDDVQTENIRKLQASENAQSARKSGKSANKKDIKELKQELKRTRPSASGMRQRVRHSFKGSKK